MIQPQEIKSILFFKGYVSLAETLYSKYSSAGFGSPRRNIEQNIPKVDDEEIKVGINKAMDYLYQKHGRMFNFSGD